MMNSMFRISLFSLFALLTFTLSAQDAPKIHLQACLDAAQSIKTPARPGDFTKVEYLDPAEGGLAALEIELTDASGQEWEFMCNAHTGAIYEIEREAESADDPAFKAGMKISEKEAIAAAKAFVGEDAEVGEIEYEIESDGGASYEFDLYSGGTEWKVEVDAATGEVIEVQVERWEIGSEADEHE